MTGAVCPCKHPLTVSRRAVFKRVRKWQSCPTVAEPRSFPKLSRNPQDEHAFHELGSRRFEHFARALHAAEPDIFNAILYAPDGQEQYGADHIAFHRTQTGSYLEVGQAKAERTFSPADIREAADKFLDNWDSHWRDKDVQRFILFVGCALKSRKAADEVILQTARFAERGVTFSLWDSSVIYDHLPGANVAVRTYLGQDWYESIFGKPAGLLTGLLQDLERGWNPNVQSLQSYVTRLNQAETAETVELKRRVRRGEAPNVIRELERALRSEAADALSSPVKAEKLRLFAGLLLPSGDFVRVRQLLDQADALDGDSDRLRSILLLEAVGSDAVIDGLPADGTADVAEVRAVALLRSNRAGEASAELKDLLETDETKAETFRLAALAKLAERDRNAAIDLIEIAIARDPDNRACQQVQAVCLFHRALSPTAPIAAGEWPEPVDLPLVRMSDDARRDLEQAETLFRSLMADPELDAHRSMVMWHFGVLACMAWRHADALSRLTELQAADAMPIPLIAWALSRALPFDQARAAAQCDAALAADPKDFETRLIRVALAMSERNLPTARSVLAEGKESLVAAGHGAIHDYWQAVIAMEAHQTPDADALAVHPWLRLRAAMGTRRKRPRRLAIKAVLDAELERDGDARVILAASQMLFDAGALKPALRAAPYLATRIATAEALATAAQIYYRNEQPAQVLETLENLDAFPGNKLPVELERVRTLCLAATGELVTARDTSLLIAQSTKSPVDLWRSIQLQLTIGAAPAALALYEENAATLAEPSPGHIALARAVLRSHPEAAVRITRHIAADAPDGYVTAAFDLANKLKLSGEQRILVGRLHQLGAEGKGGVQLIHVDDIIAMMRKRTEQMERSLEQYANGHAPVHVMAAQRQSVLAAAYLSPLLRPPPPTERSMLLSSRYGRHFDDATWPADRADVGLLVDVTALLTAHGLGLLDTAERGFAPLWIAPDTIPALLELRSDTEVAQPERVDAARALLARLDAGEIYDQADLPTTDTFHVLWEGDGGEPNSTLSFHRLFETLAKAMDAKSVRNARDQLGSTLEPLPAGAVPASGAILTLDHGIALTLEEAGLLARAAASFRVGITADEIASLRGAIVDFDRRQELIDSLSILLGKLNAGLEDGTYKMVAAPTKVVPNDHLGRSFMSMLDALGKGGVILWVDDRFTSSIQNPALRTVTTVEVIEALQGYGRVSLQDSLALRQRLRRARWLFMPFSPSEIVRYVRAATRQGKLTETEDLAILRRSMGETLFHRRRLQWPDPRAVEQEIKGEVPYLLDCGHAVSQALVAIWNNSSWTVADAEEASAWIIDTLDPGLYPTQIIAGGDPRSDHLIGVHLGGLVCVAIQILAGKNVDKRQAAYLDWLWRYLIANSLRIRPEVRVGLEEMIETHFAHDNDDSVVDAQLWRKLTARMTNALPLALRITLLQRPAIRALFELPEHGQITVDEIDFDEQQFWDAVVSVNATTPIDLRAVDGAKAKISWIEADGDSHLSMAIGRRKMRLDDWPRRVASGNAKVRREALLERIAVMDMSVDEIDTFNATLETVEPASKRVHQALLRSHGSLQQFYDDLERGVRQRRSFALSDLLPDDIGKVVRHLRLDDSLETSARRLITDRNLATAVRRLGGLPIEPSKAIVDAVAAFDDPGLSQFLDEVAPETSPPWVQLFLADALLRRPLPVAVITRIRAWTDKALSDEAAVFWRMYIALAQFTAAEGFADQAWSTLGARDQLATAWAHANAVTEILVAGGVQLNRFLDMVANQRLVSPRLLIEALNRYGPDVADPLHMTLDRLRAYLAAPVLSQFQQIGDQAAWSRDQLRNLIVAKTEDGERPRVEVLTGSLAQQDALSSRLSGQLSEIFAEVAPNGAVLVRDQSENLFEALLQNDPASEEAVAAWHLLRNASGDAALPERLAETAKDRGAMLDLTSPGDQLDSARERLITFTAVAAANHWIHEAERIDAAAMTLGPREGDDDGIDPVRDRGLARSPHRRHRGADAVSRVGHPATGQAPSPSRPGDDRGATLRATSSRSLCDAVRRSAG